MSKQVDSIRLQICLLLNEPKIASPSRNNVGQRIKTELLTGRPIEESEEAEIDFSIAGLCGSLSFKPR